MTTTASTRRDYSGPAFFTLGFRPFFLGATVLAAIGVPAWLLMLAGGHNDVGALTPLAWHVHEMIFGYVAAVIAGFALTAIPNWTGRPPVAGPRLAALFGLWLAGRLALVLPFVAFPVVAFVDMTFLFALAAVAWREVLAGGNWRNAPVCILITLLAVANAGFHAEIAFAWGDGAAVRAALAVIILLIGLIGGRVTPSFTRNWLAKRKAAHLPAPFGVFDRFALAALAVALVAWAAAPTLYAGAGLLIAGMLHAVRLARWRGWATVAEPLVLVLHVGYLWLPVSLILLGLSAMPQSGVDGTSALHAVTTGLIGLMTLAVMTRATLGHCGAPLTAGAATTAIYALVATGAILRLIAPYAPTDYMATLAVAGAFWSGGFLLFLIVFGPMLLYRRGTPSAG